MMSDKPVTPHSQSQENEPAQSTAPDGTHSESQCAMNTGSPTPLQAWMQQELAYRLQERRQQAALEDLAARLQAHLETIAQKGGNNE
jgi:hypothetical protein